MLGTFTLWFGWYAFNAGSALITRSSGRDELAALAGVNTTLSGGMAGMVALFMNLLILERSTGEPFFDLKYAMNGSLCGLVAITAGCGGELSAAFHWRFCLKSVFCVPTRIILLAISHRECSHWSLQLSNPGPRL